MSANEGRQSPPPEQQDPKQGTGAPSSGKGVNEGGDNQEASKKQLDCFESNPKGPLDDHMAEVAKKTVKNTAGELKFKD